MPYSALLACGCLLATVSCSSGPKQLRGWSREPINHGPIVLAQPSPEAAKTASAHHAPAERVPQAANVAQEPQIPALDALQAPPATTLAKAGSNAAEARAVGFTFLFPVSGANLVLPESVKADLLEAARSAERITVIGRTDGERYSLADEQVALRRALAGRAELVKAGVDPTRIAIEFASAADYAQPNNTPTGRQANRRVEFVFNAGQRLAGTP